MKRFLLCFILILAGCAPQETQKNETTVPKETKPANVGHLSTNWLQLALDFGAAAKDLKGPVVHTFTYDDMRFTTIDHEWLKAKLRAHATANRYKRGYQAELKDCDNFTLALYADIVNQFAEEADEEAGQAAAGRLNVSLEPFNVGDKRILHQVVTVRTDKGWFILDPTKDLGLTLPTIQLIPINEYKGWALAAMF